MTFAQLLQHRRNGAHTDLEPLRISLVGRIKNMDCIIPSTGDDMRGVFGLDVEVLHAGESIERIVSFLDDLCACKPWCVDLVNVLTGQRIAITRCANKRLQEITYANNPL